MTVKLRPLLTGPVRLALSVGCLLLIWLAVLPLVSTVPSVHARQEWLDSQGIDPGAMYYTELESMRPILDRLERPEPVP